MNGRPQPQGRSRQWILPLICRLGQVTKAEIGPIRIFDDETKFEIVGHAASAFADAVQADQRRRSAN